VAVDVSIDQVRWLRLRAVALSASHNSTGEFGISARRQVAPGTRSSPKRPHDPARSAIRDGPLRVTTSWLIPNSPPDSPQAKACGLFYFWAVFVVFCVRWDVGRM